jgi:hypothetical protein
MLYQLSHFRIPDANNFIIAIWAAQGFELTHN